MKEVQAFARLENDAAFVGACPDEASGRTDPRCTARARWPPTPPMWRRLRQALGEIVVTGLRQSLVTNEAIKRDSSGIVDAITAEDIGKFPDTNLAESIQRIPGVTIDRANNEGSRVTVRGFGPEFNLVTLNGRSMPGNTTPNRGELGLTGPAATRAFDFENLSADGISGITVYKTGRADVASGGIGSTINITTARPFDYHEMKATFSAKATDDTSSKVGSKVTPEFSGLFSDTSLRRPR